jgi:PTS system mannose-specific IIB component/fructoselysine and glucoselysine-specific PTS system IIB component
VSVDLVRIDDRLIHGQVVVGWGQTLGAEFIVLVDDDVAASDWEQELYRMGVPPSVEVMFASVADAGRNIGAWERDGRRGILLTGDIATMARLCAATNGAITAVNVGGIHYREGRRERLRYVYLSDEEAGELGKLARSGVEVSAQDVPTGTRVSVEDLLA